MSSGEGRRVLLTGAGGQLAASLDSVFTAAGYTVHRFTREELDIADDTAVRAACVAVQPAVILNPAAFNRVDAAEEEPGPAFAVNVEGARLLARAAAQAGATLVHYSTDYVVDGTAGRPQREDDAPRPLSAYAISKLAGEYYVRALAPQHYVLRVCGLFGLAGQRSRHGNFVETMLRAAAAGRTLRVVADQMVAPTATPDVAAVTRALIERAVPYGLYNCTAEGATSWYDYARAIFDLAGVEANLIPTTAAEYGAAAPRPSYSILDNRKLEAVGITRPRHWRTALEEYVVARR